MQVGTVFHTSIVLMYDFSLRHCEIIEMNDQIISEPSIVVMEIRVSIKSGIRDIFNMKIV